MPGRHIMTGNDSMTRDRRRWRRPLTPEEESIDDLGGEEDEIDDLLPADLWFRAADRGQRASYTPYR